MEGGGPAGAVGLETSWAAVGALAGGLGAVFGEGAGDSGFAAATGLGGVGLAGAAGAGGVDGALAWVDGAAETDEAGVAGLACFFAAAGVGVGAGVGGWGGWGGGVAAGDFWTGLADSADVGREVAFFFFLEASMMVFGLGTGAGGWGVEGGGGGGGGGGVVARLDWVTVGVTALRTGRGRGVGAAGAAETAETEARAARWGAALLAAAFFGAAAFLGAAVFLAAEALLSEAAGGRVSRVAGAGGGLAVLAFLAGDAVFGGAGVAALATFFLPEAGRAPLGADDFSGFMRAEEANLGRPEGLKGARSSPNTAG